VNLLLQNKTTSFSYTEGRRLWRTRFVFDFKHIVDSRSCHLSGGCAGAWGNVVAH